MHIAIVGSRSYPYLDDVRGLVRLIASDDPSAVIVSGGAEGVDQAAEQEALALGLGVISYKVRRISEEEYAVEEWSLGRDPYIRLMTEHPTFAKYADTLTYRNILIAGRADRVVAFRADFSRGTTFTMDMAKAADKPLREYTVAEGERFVIL